MTDLTEAMYEALNAEIGVAVKSDDVARTRSAFYAARSRDPELQVLGLHNSPTPGELFILKKEVLDAYRRTRKENAELSGG